MTLCMYCGKPVDSCNDSVDLHDLCTEPARLALAEWRQNHQQTPSPAAKTPVPEPVEGWTPPAEWWKPWMKAIAVDANGNIYGYGTKPVIHSNFKMWTNRGEGEQMLISAIDMTDKPADWWTKAIWLRPEGV